MSTEDLDAQVAALKQRITAAQQRRARAETAAEVQRQLAQESAEALQKEFGIAPGEAPALIAKHQDDLAAEARRVEEALERAEASE